MQDRKTFLRLIKVTAEEAADHKSEPHPETDPLIGLAATRESEVSCMHPLQIYFDRDELIETTQRNLEQIHRNRPPVESEVERTHIEAIIQQRVDFIEWLRAQPPGGVFLAVYPADDGTTDVLSDLDDDLMTDKEDDLPLF